MVNTWLWYRCAQHPKNTYILTAQTPLSGNCTTFLKRTFLGHPVISTTFGIGHAFHFISHRSRSIWPLFAYRFLTWDLNFFPFHYFEFIASIKHLLAFGPLETCILFGSGIKGSFCLYFSIHMNLLKWDGYGLFNVNYVFLQRYYKLWI